jgi:hypothetical protein
MFIRNYLGKMVYFPYEEYNNDRQLYTDLWKILYNIDISKNINKFNITNYI